MIIKVGFRGTASGHKFIYITLPRSYDCLFHAVIWLQIPHVVLCQEKVQIKYNQFSLFM